MRKIKLYNKMGEKTSGSVSSKIRARHVMMEQLMAVHGRACLRCGFDKEREALQIDHVIPRSRGGKNTFSNLQVLCANCNTVKGSASGDYRRVRITAERDDQGNEVQRVVHRSAEAHARLVAIAESNIAEGSNPYRARKTLRKYKKRLFSAQPEGKTKAILEKAISIK